MPNPAALLALLLVAGVHPSDDDFHKHIKQVDAKDNADRLAALRWISGHVRAPNATLAIAVLERAAAKDASAEVRVLALENLCGIALHLKRPCPGVVVRAMLDPDESVRERADNQALLFKQFEPDSLDGLLRYAQTDKGKRGGALFHLARFGPKEEQTLAAIDAARKEKSFTIRHNAEAARFAATDDLHEFHRYLIRLREDRDAILGDIDEGKDEEEQVAWVFAELGAIEVKIEWSNHRADDFAASLMKLLDNPSPLMRRGAANDVGFRAAKVERTWGRRSYEQAILDLFEPKRPPEPPEPPRKSNVALRLAKLGIEPRLKELRDNDKDVTVRAAAREALERWQKTQ